MKPHLTERELIEYRFELGSDAELTRAGEHLAECERCRDDLDRLARRFATLDLLREDITVGEDLVSKVVEQASGPRRFEVVPYRRMPAWAGAVAAAVLVVALLLIVTTPPEEPTPGEYVGRGRGEVVKVPTVGSGLHKRALDGSGLGARQKMADLGIPLKPPFAPASAIELVTLPRRDDVQLTIYNSADLTLVREKRSLTLKKGWNWLQFMWANTLIDPTSLSLEPIEQGDKIDIQQLVFPARLRELGRWLIRSEVSGQVPFELKYFTSGVSWRAFYMGTLAPDEKAMQLKGYVRVGNNSGEEYEKARTRLIVGKVHLLDEIAALAKRQYAYGRPGGPIQGLTDLASINAGFALTNGLTVEALDAVDFDARLGTLRPKEIKKEGLSEYFLYTIEGTETIPDKWGKRLLSFEAEDIEVESLYKYDEERWHNQTIRFVKFTNDEEHNLGETPLPNGQVRIYGQADDAGLLSYVGGTSVKYIPVDEEVELNLGPARLVKVEPRLMDFKTKNYMFDKKKEIAGWDEMRTWDMKVTNTRKLPIDIEITRGFGTAYWKLDVDGDGVDYTKHDATHARFELGLEPRSVRTVGYTVTTYHGVRQDAVTKVADK